jgi:hypothetical protein
MLEASTPLIRRTWSFFASGKMPKRLKTSCRLTLSRISVSCLLRCCHPGLPRSCHAWCFPTRACSSKGAIHDNFWAVQSSANLRHAQRRPCKLLKIDIAKAFDTVNWSFLHDLLSHMGFPKTVDQPDLLSALHCQYKNHSQWAAWPTARALRQGDPLSLLVFVLVMEALNGLFRHADSSMWFTSLCEPAIKFQLSLYEDDLMIFLAPEARDIRLA